MGMPELLGLLLLAAGGWYLWSNLKARETANAAISSACKGAGFLFLNDTVGLESIRPVRDEQGRVILRRIFGFEYSDTGHERRKGTVTLVGGNVTALDVGRPPTEGVTLH